MGNFPCEHKQKVRKTIEERNGRRGEGYLPREFNRGSLGLTARGASQMTLGCLNGSPWENELFERWEVLVVVSQPGFNPSDVGGFNGDSSGDIEIAPKVK
jgi:hypothetical protein